VFLRVRADSAELPESAQTVTTRVFGWSADNGGCQFYRLQVPLDYMAANDSGVIVNVDRNMSPFTDDDGKRHAPDVVIGQRVSQPGPAKMWSMLADGSLGVRPRLVYEIDDDLFNVPSRNVAAARHFNQPAVQDTMRRCMALADVITVSTGPLARVVMTELNKVLTTRASNAPRVMVIPNALPDMAYNEPGPTRRDPGGLVTVGWAGSSSHEEDFDEVAQPLTRFLRRTPAARFHAIGHLFRSVKLRSPRNQLQLTSWIHDMADYYRALDSFDVGIIPLRPSVFNRSKSDLKFLEYAARGIPIITSNCGPYEMHADNNRALGADNPHEWLDCLTANASVPAVRGREVMAYNAFQYAKTRGVQSTAALWRKAVLG
jgi:glycosyltransferase involved in cell wall biosynthesis